jgi:hypothetical protein
LYRYELALVIREEYKLRMFQKRVLRTIFGSNRRLEKVA